MYNISIVYDKPGTRELIIKAPSKKHPFIQFFDMNTVEGKKNGYKIKSTWGAKANPFVLIEDGDTPIKCFYSEYDWKDDAVEQLLNWLKDA